jgi:hypothetical protein
MKGSARVSIDGQLARLAVTGAAALRVVLGAGDATTSLAPADRRMTTTARVTAALAGVAVEASLFEDVGWAIAPMRASAVAALRLPASIRPPAAAWRRRACCRGVTAATPGSVGSSDVAGRLARR